MTCVSVTCAKEAGRLFLPPFQLNGCRVLFGPFYVFLVLFEPVFHGKAPRKMLHCAKRGQKAAQSRAMLNFKVAEFTIFVTSKQFTIESVISEQ